MKKILILGAGIYQVPLINKAKKLGYYTIVTSIKGNYPGFALADKVYYANTMDADACLKIAVEEHVDGVCTAGTDVALPSLGRITDALKLSGPSEQSSTYSFNKALMKKAFERNGVRTAKYGIASSCKECHNIASQMTFPVMIKVVDSSGSRGIIKVNFPEMLTQAYESVLSFTRQNYVIVEEYVQGIEFGAQAMVQNGEIIILMPHGDLVFQAKTGVPVGHYVPYESDESVLKDIKEQVELSIKALGINNAAINADFILSNGKVYVLEIGARAGATGLSELVSLYYGIDYYEYIIKLAMGQKLEIPSPPLHCAYMVKLLTSDKAGKIIEISNRIDDPNLVDYVMDYDIGDAVNKFAIGPDRIGHYIVKGASLTETFKNGEYIERLINLIVE